MDYCSKCGAAVRVKAGTPTAYEKQEKEEKDEKNEKEEKHERHEKEESGRFWALIVGLILMAIGAISLIGRVFNVSQVWRGAAFLVIAGVLIVIVAVYGAAKASQRNPRP